MGQETRIGSGRTADILAIGDGRVHKRFHAGTAVDVARKEAEHTRIAADAGVPVPAVHAVYATDGRPAIEFDRIDGATMRAQLAARPWTLWRHARRLATLHATLHAVHPSGLRSLRERLAQRIREAPDLSADDRNRVRSQLESLAGGDALCHGDFHPENVLLSANGPVVIDWLDAASGPPAADVARTSVLLRFAGHGDGRLSSWGLAAYRRTYLRRYCRLTACTRDEIRAWELPVATARLVEGVPESAPLRSFVRSRLAEQ